MQRERQAQYGDGSAVRRGPARDPGAGRTASDDQRQPFQLAVDELLDDRRPGHVEPRGGG